MGASGDFIGDKGGSDEPVAPPETGSGFIPTAGVAGAAGAGGATGAGGGGVGALTGGAGFGVISLTEPEAGADDRRSPNVFAGGGEAGGVTGTSLGTINGEISLDGAGLGGSATTGAPNLVTSVDVTGAGADSGTDEDGIAGGGSGIGTGAGPPGAGGGGGDAGGFEIGSMSSLL